MHLCTQQHPSWPVKKHVKHKHKQTKNPFSAYPKHHFFWLFPRFREAFLERGEFLQQFPCGACDAYGLSGVLLCGHSLGLFGRLEIRRSIRTIHGTKVGRCERTSFSGLRKGGVKGPGRCGSKHRSSQGIWKTRGILTYPWIPQHQPIEICSKYTELRPMRSCIRYCRTEIRFFFFWIIQLEMFLGEQKSRWHLQMA